MIVLIPLIDTRELAVVTVLTPLMLTVPSAVVMVLMPLVLTVPWAVVMVFTPLLDSNDLTNVVPRYLQILTKMQCSLQVPRDNFRRQI